MIINNIKKLKVMTIVGTRPEIIRLSAVIAKLEESTAIEHILVHTGQNYDYELNEVFFNDFNLKKPDYFLNAAGCGASETIGKIIISIDLVFEKENPELLNDGELTAPSKRLERLIPGFDRNKPFYGGIITDVNTIEPVLERCVRFRAWVELLISKMKA